MDEKDFALRLAQLREKKNVSAREMSLAIGQNPGYINNIESGKSLPSLPGVFYICDYLGILEEELHTVIYDIISKQAEVIFNTSSIGAVSASTLQAEQQVELHFANEQENILKLQISNMRERIAEINLSEEDFRIERHNFRHKIDSIATMAENKQYDELIEYLQKYHKKLDETKVKRYT